MNQTCIHSTSDLNIFISTGYKRLEKINDVAFLSKDISLVKNCLFQNIEMVQMALATQDIEDCNPN